jgi:uncharacterized protein YkwD
MTHRKHLRLQPPPCTTPPIKAATAALVAVFCVFPLFAAREALAAPGPDAARGELLRRINQERATVGSLPLAASAQLTEAAQQHADELSRRGKLDGGRPSATADMDLRLRRLGYQAAEWTEGVYATTGDLAGVISEFQQHDRNTYRRLLDPNYRDLGIGVSRLGDMALYTFLFAVPEAEHFARQTAPLRDLAKVRAEMLAAVADVRRKAGLRPLAGDAALDRAAQRHAEDMLARSYFAHESPEGATVRQRADAAGYAWRTIGENIAEGQLSVDEVMASWMKSRPHRANLLHRPFTQLGAGLAFGRDPKTGEYRTVWVQTFGQPK